MPYMQNRKRDTDVQNRLLDSVGEGEGGMFWEYYSFIWIELVQVLSDLYLSSSILFSCT